jgi:hypothetical protein
MKKRPRNSVVVRIDARGFSSIIFSPHALDRLKQRVIRREDVIQAIRAPTRMNLPANPPNQRLAWQKNYRTEIHVVYYEQKPRLIVVTAFVQG